VGKIPPTAPSAQQPYGPGDLSFLGSLSVHLTIQTDFNDDSFSCSAGWSTFTLTASPCLSIVHHRSLLGWVLGHLRVPGDPQLYLVP
jgi:hypothetical protein